MTRSSLWGITFDSEVPLPGRDPGPGPADVEIRFGEVPGGIDDVRSEGVAYQAGPGVFRFAIPGMVSFLIRGGTEIVVDPAPGTHPDTVAVLLLGTPMGALLHQRERIPLHAAAVEIDGAAVLISGFSSNGKSTVAAALHRLGHRVVADDVCAIHADDGPVIAEPGPTELQLWKDGVRRLGMDTDYFLRARPELGRYRVPVTTVDGPLPVSGIYVLGTHNREGIEVDEIEHLGRVRTVLAQTRGSGYLEGLGAKASHFRTSMAVAKGVRLRRLVWPRGVSSVDDVRDALLKDLAS